MSGRRWLSRTHSIAYAPKPADREALSNADLSLIMTKHAGIGYPAARGIFAVRTVGGGAVIVPPVQLIRHAASLKTISHGPSRARCLRGDRAQSLAPGVDSVSGGPAQDCVADVCAGRRAAWTFRWVGLLPGDQITVPARQQRRRGRERHSMTREAAAARARPAGHGPRRSDRVSRAGSPRATITHLRWVSSQPDLSRVAVHCRSNQGNDRVGDPGGSHLTEGTPRAGERGVA
jgi:hypothetical protein